MATKTKLKPAAVKPAAAKPTPRPLKPAKASTTTASVEAAVPTPASKAEPEPTAPKAAKPAKPKAPAGPRLTEGPYNFALARFRRVAAQVLSDGDADSKRQLTSGLRKCVTYLEAKKFLLEYFQEHQVEDMLDRHYFVASKGKE